MTREKPMTAGESRRLIRQHQLSLCNKIAEREDKANLREIDFDLNECTEHHLPSDCPLCGAK